MQIQGQVGQPSAQSIQPGAQPLVRLGQLSDVIVSELHGRYYEQGYRKTSFGAANQAAVATTAAFATTYTGLVLYNPNGSAVNLVVQKFGAAPILAQTTTLALGLMILSHIQPAMAQSIAFMNSMKLIPPASSASNSATIS